MLYILAILLRKIFKYACQINSEGYGGQVINEEFEIEIHLKDLRKKSKLSQEELAEELGISRQSIIALEQGKSLPSLPLAISMCRFFDSAFEDLFNFGQEIEHEMDRIFDNEKKYIGNNIENIEKNIINNIEEPIRLSSQDSGMNRSGLLDRKENIMGNEMEPWRPFREVVSLRDAMDRLFEDSVITPKGVTVMPKIDIKDQKDNIIVKAELPGMTEDDINIEVSDGVMTISGEKKEEVEENPPAGGEGYYYKESHSGSFTRSFTLPAEVREEKAEAAMDKGVLTITIPKIEPKKATKVKIAPKKK